MCSFNVNVIGLKFLGAFLSQHDDHLHMFTVEDAESEVIDECGMYPALEETLENFTTDDVESDGTREPICNYEWADDIDVINVLHGVSEWPVALQVCVNFKSKLNYFCDSFVFILF